MRRLRKEKPGCGFVNHIKIIPANHRTPFMCQALDSTHGMCFLIEFSVFCRHYCFYLNNGKLRLRELQVTCWGYIAIRKVYTVLPDCQGVFLCFPYVNALLTRVLWDLSSAPFMGEESEVWRMSDLSKVTEWQ